MRCTVYDNLISSSPTTPFLDVNVMCVLLGTNEVFHKYGGNK